MTLVKFYNDNFVGNVEDFDSVDKYIYNILKYKTTYILHKNPLYKDICENKILFSLEQIWCMNNDLLHLFCNRKYNILKLKIKVACKLNKLGLLDEGSSILVSSNSNEGNYKN